MNREIIFRGKRVDNGEWVYGDFVNSHEGWHIIESDYFKPSNGDHPELTEVDPSTAGQFTGLTDKNGVRIFEGDILGDWNNIDGVMTQSKMQVFWDSKAGAWGLDNSYKQDKSSGDLLSEELALFAYEVAGNIHDTHLTKQS